MWTFSKALRKVRVLLTIVVSFTLTKMHSQKRFYEFSQTSLEGTLALAGTALEEALLVLGEGAAIEAPVPVGDLLPGLLLAELWACGAASFPR